MHFAGSVGVVFGSVVRVGGVRVFFSGCEGDRPVGGRRPQRAAMGCVPDIGKKPD